MGKECDPPAFRVGLIAELFLNHERQGGACQIHGQSLFQPEVNEEQSVIFYSVTIMNIMQFQLVSKYLSHDLSFSQVSNVLLPKELTGIGRIGSVFHGIVFNFARVVVAVNMFLFHHILKSVDMLGYSLALDSSTHQGFSYSAMRLQVYYKDSLLNLHVSAVPLFDQHTAVNIVNLMLKFGMLFVHHGATNL